MEGKIPLAAIVGPTATGKSEIALEVAARLNAEIISVDSAQVYRGMDIGTAKVPPDERVSPEGLPIPHYMIDIIDPDQPFSVADFQRMARDIIDDIYRRDRLPMLVGGTGLYYQAVVDPYRFTPMPGEKLIRGQLEETAAKLGNDFLHERLKIVDPEAARRIHPNDRRRLIRALEVYTLTGEPISRALTWRTKQKGPYLLVPTAIDMSRPLLYQRIEKRVDLMLERGLVEEVRQLLDKYDYRLPAMQILGYKEIGGYVRGETGFAESVEALKRNTRRLAKRQLTWFRRDERLHWLKVDDNNYKGISTMIAKIIREKIAIIQE